MNREKLEQFPIVQLILTIENNTRTYLQQEIMHFSLACTVLLHNQLSK